MSSFKAINIELYFKLIKLLKLFFYPSLIPFLFKGIMPSLEHEKSLRLIGRVGSLVDCGCNKGQFALFSFRHNIFSQYVAFDPIIYPYKVINYLKKQNVKVFFSTNALSNEDTIKRFFLTKRDDSSSLKKPKNIASDYFSNVYLVGEKDVNVSKLNSFIDLIGNLIEPRLLKIDVQGNEFELLKGAKDVLIMFKFIVIECTYFDLYENIEFKTLDVDNFLVENNFILVLEYNKVFRKSKLISSDRLYMKNEISK